MADPGLPSALPHELMILGDAPRGTEDEAPGEFSGVLVTAAGTAGTAHSDALVLQRRHVERGVAHAGSDQQLHLRESFDNGFLKRCTLAHRCDELGIGERPHHRLFIGEGVALDGNLDSPIPYRRPIRHIERHALVIVENAEPHHRLPLLPRSYDAIAFCRFVSSLSRNWLVVSHG